LKTDRNYFVCLFGANITYKKKIEEIPGWVKGPSYSIGEPRTRLDFRLPSLNLRLRLNTAWPKKVGEKKKVKKLKKGEGKKQDKKKFLLQPDNLFFF